jgi:hypothetical protein
MRRIWCRYIGGRWAHDDDESRGRRAAWKYKASVGPCHHFTLADLTSCLNHSPCVLLGQLIVRLFSDCRPWSYSSSKVPTAQQQDLSTNSLVRFQKYTSQIASSARCHTSLLADHSQLQFLPWAVAKFTWAASLNIWCWLAATAVVPDAGSASLIA